MTIPKNTKKSTARAKQVPSSLNFIFKKSENNFQNKRLDIARAILVTLATVGIISIAVLAPNAMVLLSPPGKKRGRQLTTAEVRRAIRRLATRGHIRIRNLRGEQLIELTDSGKDRLNAINVSNWRPQNTKRWDRKWRLVIFDIPELSHTVRDRIRRTLRSIGLLQIQKSVYLYPYDCYELVVSLRQTYKLTSNLTYALVEQIEEDTKYRRHFNLIKK